MTVEQLDKQVFKFPKHSHIRLLVTREHHFNLNFNEIKARYLDYHIKKQVKDIDSEKDAVTYIANDTTQLDTSASFSLDTDLYSILKDKVLLKYPDLSEVERKKYMAYIEPFKQTGVTHENVLT